MVLTIRTHMKNVTNRLLNDLYCFVWAINRFEEKNRQFHISTWVRYSFGNIFCLCLAVIATLINGQKVSRTTPPSSEGSKIT